MKDTWTDREGIHNTIDWHRARRIITEYDTRAEAERVNATLDAIAAELDDMRRRLAAVETWQQLSRGD